MKYGKKTMNRNVKKFFKPTKGKIIITIIIGVLWLFILVLFTAGIRCFCKLGGFEGCTDYYKYLLIKLGCHCSCVSLNEVFLSYFWNLIIPLILGYIIASAIIWFRR